MPLLLSEMFEFAAPPRTGVHWVVRACREAGLMLFPNNGSVAASLLPWPEQADTSSKGMLRVSLVRHPCDWLRSVYDIYRLALYLGNPELTSLVQKLVIRSGCDFDQFVSDYLETKPGEISRIFNSYKADSRMRLEDMPWALVELLESFGVKQKSLDRVMALPPQEKILILNRSKWHPDLRQRVLDAEVKLCQDLDYY